MIDVLLVVAAMIGVFLAACCECVCFPLYIGIADVVMPMLPAGRSVVGGEGSVGVR